MKFLRDAVQTAIGDQPVHGLHQLALTIYGTDAVVEVAWFEEATASRLATVQVSVQGSKPLDRRSQAFLLKDFAVSGVVTAKHPLTSAEMSVATTKAESAIPIQMPPSVEGLGRTTSV